MFVELKYFILGILFSLRRFWFLIKPTRVRWKRLDGKFAVEPFRAHAEDGGFDVYAAEDMVIPAGGHCNVGCGIAVEVESGWSYNIRGRSGLNKKGILAALGLCDAYYNGEIRVFLSNFSGHDHKVLAGERVAQLQIQPVMDMPWQEVSEFKVRPGKRGNKGFGSSGA